MFNETMFKEQIIDFNRQIDIIKNICNTDTAESIEILKVYKLNEIKQELVNIDCSLEYCG